MPEKLRKPAAPADVRHHAASKTALQALRHRVRHARRAHAFAIVALDALFKEMRDELSNTPLRKKAGVIERAAVEVKPYLWNCASTEESP